MNYVVSEDLVDATETKVHRETCRYYLNRKGNATTVKWHGPFDDYKIACQKAQKIAHNKRFGTKLNPYCCNPA